MKGSNPEKHDLEVSKNLGTSIAGWFIITGTSDLKNDNKKLI
jgi:hypothetical protein